MLLLRGRVYVVNAPGIERTDRFLEAIFKSARLFTDGHYGPDENLQTAEGTHTDAQRFAPGREHIGAVAQRRTVHLDEDVGQDER